VEKKLNYCIFHLHVEFEVTNFTSDLESGLFWGKINFYFYFCYVHSQFPANNIVDGILEFFFNFLFMLILAYLIIWHVYSFDKIND
jgi:hypothetical protein